MPAANAPEYQCSRWLPILRPVRNNPAVCRWLWRRALRRRRRARLPRSRCRRRAQGSWRRWGWGVRFGAAAHVCWWLCGGGAYIQQEAGACMLSCCQDGSGERAPLDPSLCLPAGVPHLAAAAGAGAALCGPVAAGAAAARAAAGAAAVREEVHQVSLRPLCQGGLSSCVRAGKQSVSCPLQGTMQAVHHQLSSPPFRWQSALAYVH